MNSGYLEKYCKRIKKWSKLFLPQKNLRYYPPKFVLRDPVLEGVYTAVSSGQQVAVIVVNMSNLRDELSQQLEPNQLEEYKRELRKGFKHVFEQTKYNKDLLVVHDYYSDGLTLFVKINDDKQSVVHIENLLRIFMPKLEKWMLLKYPYFDLSFEIGYMFIEKEHYTTQEAIYNAQQQAVAMAEKRIQSRYIQMLLEIREIIQKRDISLLAQPIIDLATKQIKAWEVLTRGPEKTSLESPLHLFSVARQANLIYDLELLVLEKAFQLIMKVGCREDIFINFTPITLGNKRFIPALEKMLKRYEAIDPKKLILEVTERDSIEGLKFFHDNIKELRRKGIRIAVDDTGAGYSSLHTISEIMPDIIKIDRSVIQDIDTNSVKESMLKGLVLIAKETGSLVVAEGIEKEAEAEVLSRNQVDLAQGYYYARPGTLEKARVAF